MIFLFHEDAEEFVRLNPSLVVAGECVSVSLAEYNPDEIFALKVVKARSTIKSHEIELYMENKVPGFTLKFEDLEGGDTIVSCEDHRGKANEMGYIDCYTASLLISFYRFYQMVIGHLH